MSENVKQIVDTKSVEFKKGVEAGLHSTEDTKNWKAGNEFGRDLKADGGIKEPTHETPGKQSPPPLFIRESRDSNKGNAQDEKDATEE